MHPGEAREFNPDSLSGVCDVLTNQKHRMQRQASLLQAIALQAMQPTDVLLTIEGPRLCTRLRTRILATGDDRVVLEHGVSIPIQCIHRVEILT